LKERRTIYEENLSSSVDKFRDISRTSRATEFTTSEVSSRQKKSIRELFKVSFILSRDEPSKNIARNQFTNLSGFLKKQQSKVVAKSILLIFSQSSLQKLKNRRSEAFSKNRESSQFIISFSVSSEADMTCQHQSNRSDQDIQEMIQVVIRGMISKIVQQSVVAATTMNAASNSSVNRSNSSQQFMNQSQMTSRSTSESRSNR
jgi:hypothetical protein